MIKISGKNFNPCCTRFNYILAYAFSWYLTSSKAKGIRFAIFTDDLNEALHGSLIPFFIIQR